MPDRVTYTLHTAVASNTGGPYVTTWDRVVVTSAGTIRSVVAVSPSIASNARQNTVDVYLQPNGPAAGSNTATPVLVTPITLVNNEAAVAGTIRESSARVAVGDQLQLRTSAGNLGSQPAFAPLKATVEVERD